MFSALTGEFRVLLNTVLENQTTMALEMKKQNHRLDVMNSKINKMHDKLMAGMKTLQVAFDQIKTVGEYFEDSMCEGLGKMSHMHLDM